LVTGAKPFDLDNLVTISNLSRKGTSAIVK